MHLGVLTHIILILVKHRTANEADKLQERMKASDIHCASIQQFHIRFVWISCSFSVIGIYRNCPAPTSVLSEGGRREEGRNFQIKRFISISLTGFLSNRR